MRKAWLFVVAILCCSTLNAFAGGTILGIGGGLTSSSIEAGGEDENFTGGFVTFSGVLVNGFYFQANLSRVEEDFTTVEGFEVLNETDTLTRLALSAGYMFRAEEAFRPFLHGGIVFANAEVEATLSGVGDPISGELLDDSSTALSLGVGFEAGSRHHAFYFDLSADTEHEFEFNFGLGTLEIDVVELDLGYKYRF